MNRKVTKYLEKKEKSDYTILDNLFVSYNDGYIEKLLKKFGFSQIEIHPTIHKNSNDIQVNFSYLNLYTTIAFYDTWLEYCVYLSGCSAETFDESFVEIRYNNSFTIEKFISEIYEILNNDNRLNKSDQ